MFYSRYRLGLSRLFGLSTMVLALFCARSLESIAAMGETMYFFGVTFVALATVGRVWCSIYISGYKNDRLIQEGPYSISRNPLYLCNVIGGIGLGLATETLLIPILIAIAIAIYYPKVIQEEEKELKGHFGAEYEAYCLLTPRFLPHFSGYHAPETYNVNTRVLTRELIRSFLFIFGMGFLELVEALHAIGVLPELMQIY